MQYTRMLFLFAATAGLCVLATGPLGADELLAEDRGTNESVSAGDGQSGDGSAGAGAVRTRKATLEEVLAFARAAQMRIENDIQDYTCRLYKREYVDGEVMPWQLLEAKVRHPRKEDGKEVPFSVFIRFLKPDRLEGRTVIYVRGRYNGDLIARRGGQRSPNMTFQLLPTGPLAMDGNRYPITEMGFQNLAVRLIEVLEQETKYRDGELQIWENALVGDRVCTHFRLTHRQHREGLTYHMAEVSVDDELGVPIRYGAYDFPKQEGGTPQLLEQYIFTNVQLNVGLTDKDFDPRNPEYQFQLLDSLDALPMAEK